MNLVPFFIVGGATAVSFLVAMLLERRRGFTVYLLPLLVLVGTGVWQWPAIFGALTADAAVQEAANGFRTSIEDDWVNAHGDISTVEYQQAASEHFGSAKGIDWFYTDEYTVHLSGYRGVCYHVEFNHNTGLTLLNDCPDDDPHDQYDPDLYEDGPPAWLPGR